MNYQRGKTMGNIIPVKNLEGRYELPGGGFLSSPSRILRPLTVDKYSHIPPHFLAMAAKFGKEAHSFIENYELLGADDFAKEEVSELLYSGNHVKTFNQYLDWRLEYNVNVLETEKLVYSIEERYFGYIDLITEVEFNGKKRKMIVDVKTRSKLQTDDNWLTETLQLMLYKDAYREMTGEDLDIALLVISKTTKTKRLFKVISQDEQMQLWTLLSSLKMVNTQLINIKEANDVK